MLQVFMYNVGAIYIYGINSNEVSYKLHWSINQPASSHQLHKLN